MKKVVLLLTAICMSILLTGCMDVDMAEKVSKDGYISQTSKVYLDKEAYLDSYEDLTGINLTSAKTEVNRELLSEGYNVETIDGVEYYTREDMTSDVATPIEKYAKDNRQTAAKGQEQYWESGMHMKFASLNKKLISQITNGRKLSDKVLKKCYVNYSIEFDYDIVEVDSRGAIDPSNPKKATWKLTFYDINKGAEIYAYCKSGITVAGVEQGASYKGDVKLSFTGATATYKGQAVANDTTFSEHGQHTVLLKAASGEQRTVTFFIDKKKPAIKSIKKNETYKKGKKFVASDADSGIASVKVNGKAAKLIGFNAYKLTKKGKNRIVVKDNVGNVTKMTVKIK